MVAISVVVPVYNVENYLSDCLDSLINQTFKDIEIICINDGSKDNSLEILEEYAKKDSRMKVFSQENGGHAVATNKGISMATGKYLFCMDSDDVLELNALELSYNRAEEKDVDFVIFKAINYNNSDDEYYETEVYSMDKVYNKVGDEVFNYRDLGDLIFEMSVTPWSKLYKREFIVDNNIIFPEGLIFEDNVFFYDALLTAERICFLNEFLFIRRWYSTSSTTAGDLRFLSSIGVTNLVIETFEKHNEYDNFKKNLWDFKIKNNMMRYKKIKNEYKETFFNELKKDLLSYVGNPKYAEDITSSLSYTYKKMLEQFLIATNSFEYDNIRRTYANKMKSDNLVKKLDYNHLFNVMYENFWKSLGERRDKSFLFLRFVLNQLYDHDYETIINKLSFRNRKIIEQILISSKYIEFELLRDMYNNKSQKSKLNNEKNNLEEKYDSVKQFNESLLSSNSLKLANKLNLGK
ncbi:MAG: hypothetical protein BZ135_02285 [Methanosphaera sp. rholeuAM6]|nr:MAG: hypothetical protein BZ135_02285 [Methanosphaera sp. rholeuAM6]